MSIAMHGYKGTRESLELVHMDDYPSWSTSNAARLLVHLGYTGDIWRAPVFSVEELREGIENALVRVTSFPYVKGGYLDRRFKEMREHLKMLESAGARYVSFA